MTLNTAALAPIPSAKVRMVTAANTGVRLSCRIAKRKSCSMLLGRSSTAGGCHAVPAPSPCWYLCLLRLTQKEPWQTGI